MERMCSGTVYCLNQKKEQRMTHPATQVVRDFLAAVQRGDRRAILANHSDDLLMFDFPDTVEGLKEYDAQWSFFFDNQTGPITFAPEDLRTVGNEDVAFVSCLVHCARTSGGDFRFRLTVGLEERDGGWEIVHEHHSLPTKEVGMVMPEKRSSLGVS
jgi:ketosteroid isomerase-like protein